MFRNSIDRVAKPPERKLVADLNIMSKIRKEIRQRMTTEKNKVTERFPYLLFVSKNMSDTDFGSTKATTNADIHKNAHNNLGKSLSPKSPFSLVY